jgi:hypothetical protein
MDDDDPSSANTYGRDAVQKDLPVQWASFERRSEVC